MQRFREQLAAGEAGPKVRRRHRAAAGGGRYSTRGADNISRLRIVCMRIELKLGDGYE